MTDFDILARLRRLEAELGTAKDRIGQLERTSRRYHDAPEYKAHHIVGHSPTDREITDHEAEGAMLYTMRHRGD